MLVLVVDLGNDREEGRCGFLAAETIDRWPTKVMFLERWTK